MGSMPTKAVTPPMVDAQVCLRGLIDKFRKEARIAVIGMGYVGLPLISAFNEKGFDTIGFDLDPAKVQGLNAGRSPIGTIDDARVARMLANSRFAATGDFSQLASADAIIVCVPTPLTKQREPDISYVIETGRSIARHMRRGQLVVLESTTYPGTTIEEFLPVLETSGLRSGRDFLLAYSPEREDPGNASYDTRRIPKVVGGDGPEASEAAQLLYAQVAAAIVPVSSTQTAEAVKLTENIFRAVNVALVNELKVVFSRMGIDIWEVIEAAKTKPFGYMPFYPGPGLGGHCIPVDPFYLTWKAREFGVTTRFIELAGEINRAMPEYVVGKLADALDGRFARGLNGARILIMGLAYKKNVDDCRESPAFRLIELLIGRGARVDYYDPYIAVVPKTREHGALAGLKSMEWNANTLDQYDAALICTDHDNVDYAALVARSKLVVDSRNATRKVAEHRDRIVLA
jgi:UDP-N-acetyl-D-glucosamine dehydrogenase